MSATILYHMLGIRGYRFVKQKVVPGGIEFHIECHGPVCPCCGSANVWRKGGKVRTFREVHEKCHAVPTTIAERLGFDP